jgi:rare lipoprotein A
VENTRNHQSVVVRITDRGILYGRRVIDLSYAAAEKIGMTEAGVAPVTIEVLAPSQAQAN